MPAWQPLAPGKPPVTSVQLLAVSKTFGADAVREAVRPASAALARTISGGRGQDGRRARHGAAGRRGAAMALHRPDPEQQDPAGGRDFDWAQTVDRLKIAERLSAQRPAGMAPLNVCIQVNVDGGATKSGVMAEQAWRWPKPW
jgi:hypothetical protein